MSNTKATIDFSGYPAADLAPAAQNIVDSLFGNAFFPTPPFVQGTLQNKVTEFLVKLADKASRATADIIAFNIFRHELEVMLAELGSYVNNVAAGRLEVVQASGFPYYDTAHPANYAAPAAPTSVVLRHGDVPGSIVARYRPPRANSINEVQVCTGDPNVEANWAHGGLFSGGKATLSGLAIGTTIWIRIRTVGLKGVMGNWSDPAKIVVI